MLSRILEGIDKWSECQKWLGLIAPILMGVVVFDVVRRYFFRLPTIWGFETELFLYGAIFVLGFAYALRRGTHVRIDILTSRLPTRVQAGLMAGCYLVCFFVTCVVILYYSSSLFLHSWAIRETTETPWHPPLYPIKAAIPIGIFLIMLQGLAELIRSVIAAVKGGKA